MKLTFVTNYMTHHQLPFCLEMVKRLGDGFRLVETNVMEDERLHMGWGLDPSAYDFVLRTDEYEGPMKKLVMESDAVICGGASVYYVLERMDEGKLTFRYHERLYKKGRQQAFAPRGYLKKLKEHTKYRKLPVYLLCAGAYVPADFSLFFSYPGKMRRWGYFPEFIEYSEEELARPAREETRILWTGREIAWKHAETALQAAYLLKEEGISFHLDMIGEGECRSELEAQRKRYGLEKETGLENFAAPAEVRRRMLESDIYLMTSDYEEGWGAVVNEAMNAGCAVAASHAAGSVPYLIRDTENGCVYPFGRSSRENAEMLAGILKILCRKPELRSQLGKAAYETIAAEWNAQTAAERLLEFCTSVLGGEEKSWESGPMSAAPKIAPAAGYAHCSGKK